MPSETVYAVRRNGWRYVFHTDRDCTYLQRATGRIQERDRAQLEADDDWSECQNCADAMDWDTTSRGHYASLVDAAEGGSS